MKLADAIGALLLATQADGRSPRTVSDYVRKLRPLTEFLGNVEVETVTPDDLRRYVVSLQNQTTRWVEHPKLEAQTGPLSDFSIAGYVRAAKRLFNFLEDERLIDYNPARRIRNPQPKVKIPKAIEIKDFLELLRVTAGSGLADLRDRAVILMLADTGCRVSGLAGLCLSDLDLNSGVAMVTEKGDQTRAVMFTEPTAAALQAWLAVRPGDRGSSVFVSLGPKCRGGMSAGAIGEMLKRRAEQAGISGRVNPHSFRHAFARHYLLSGGDLATLSDLMGHSGVEVTRAFYAIFTLGELQAQHRKHSMVNRLLGGGNDSGNNGDS